MTVVARAIKGKEFLYSAASAHRVTPKKAQTIADALNRAQYGITPEQVWFVYDVGAYDNAYAYGEMQGFQMQKDGTIRKVGRA
jgi:hypothetical protein